MHRGTVQPHNGLQWRTSFSDNILSLNLALLLMIAFSLIAYVFQCTPFPIALMALQMDSDGDGWHEAERFKATQCCVT